MEKVTDFIFLGTKITVGGDNSHEMIKRRLLFGRKAMTNLDNMLKKAEILTLPTKVHLVKVVQTTGFSSSDVWT